MPKTLNLEHPPFLLSVTSLLLSYNRFLNAFYNVVDVIVRDIRTSRQTEAYLKQFLLYPIRIYRSTLIHGLFVHGLPYRTTLNLLAQHEHTQCLNILIRLTICSCRVNGMYHTCCTTYGSLDNFLVGILLLVSSHLHPK